MASLKHDKKVAPQFAADCWCLIETGFDGATLAVSEALLSQANGYLGTRGTFEEPVSAGISSIEGTYLNGVYLREPIHYDENAYGFATHNNKMILVPDAKNMRLTINGQLVLQGAEQMVEQTRSLDMRNGLLSRSSCWKGRGSSFLIETRRMVSMARPGIMVLEYEITAEQVGGNLSIETGLDGAYGVVNHSNDPRAGALSIADCYGASEAQANGDFITVFHKIKGREHCVVSACLLTVEGMTAGEPLERNAFWGARFSGKLQAGEKVLIRKYVYYGDAAMAGKDDLLAAARRELKETAAIGFGRLLEEHKNEFTRFWTSTDMDIAASPDVQQGMRFNLFHLFQSVGKDGERALGAKGLSGPGYDGHYFWDTEIYAVPFFVFTQPKIARALIAYRIQALGEARKRARQMGHEIGALYPWRTISGEECSSFFPAGSAQYHINAAIAYALTQYMDATGDESLLFEGGAEMLFETARIWMALGHFSTRHGDAFSIHEVTGPDEYSAMVDNNLYTNAMAKRHLQSAARFAKALRITEPEFMNDLSATIGLEVQEVAAWEKAAEAMYLPFDDIQGVHAQCEGFLAKPEWDFESTAPEQYPLLLNFHPLKIYRHQVLKQADVVLAQVLLPDQFTADQKVKNLAYYEPRTTHDSTLSACIYSIANAESGDRDSAYEMFEETYRMDLENRHGNTHYGLHMACMAGSWMAVSYGFAGMRFSGGQLSFNPYLPKGWKHYVFQLQVKSGTLKVEIAPAAVTYLFDGSESIWIIHRGTAQQLTAQQPVTLV